MTTEMIDPFQIKQKKDDRRAAAYSVSITKKTKRRSSYRVCLFSPFFMFILDLKHLYLFLLIYLFACLPYVSLSA